MSNVLLAVIALGVVVMATIQVTAAIMAARAARRIDDLVSRFDADVRPIFVNLQKITADAAHASALAAAQVEKIDKVMNDVSRHVESTVRAIPALVESARDGFNVIGGLKAVVSAFRDMRRSNDDREERSSDEEDALFIG